MSYQLSHHISHRLVLYPVCFVHYRIWYYLLWQGKFNLAYKMNGNFVIMETSLICQNIPMNYHLSSVKFCQNYHECIKLYSLLTCIISWLYCYAPIKNKVKTLHVNSLRVIVFIYNHTNVRKLISLGRDDLKITLRSFVSIFFHWWMLYVAKHHTGHNERESERHWR